MMQPLSSIGDLLTTCNHRLGMDSRARVWSPGISGVFGVYEFPGSKRPIPTENVLYKREERTIENFWAKKCVVVYLIAILRRCVGRQSILLDEFQYVWMSYAEN